MTEKHCQRRWERGNVECEWMASIWLKENHLVALIQKSLTTGGRQKHKQVFIF